MITKQRAIAANRHYFKAATAVLLVIDLAACATTPTHRFTEPTSNWHTKTGQFMYRTPQTTLVGDVLVRFSNAGDFELVASKGPGIRLLSLRQDATFAEVKGAIARGGWSGTIEQAPPQLRGWLSLRDKLIHSQNQRTVRYVAGRETFVFRF